MVPPLIYIWSCILILADQQTKCWFAQLHTSGTSCWFSIVPLLTDTLSGLILSIAKRYFGKKCIEAQTEAAPRSVVRETGKLYSLPLIQRSIEFLMFCLQVSDFLLVVPLIRTYEHMMSHLGRPLLKIAHLLQKPLGVKPWSTPQWLFTSRVGSFE